MVRRDTDPTVAPVADPTVRWPGDRGGHLWPKDREVVRGDGTRIRYTLRGPDDAPWVALCSGFLCPDNFWARLGPPLMERYRVIVFNYRGTGASTDPRRIGYRARRVTADDYAIEKLAGDLAAILDQEGVDTVVPIGHSMGCQVALEVFRQLGRTRVPALGLITGPFASPFTTFYGTNLAAYLLPLVRAGTRAVPTPFIRALPYVLRLPIAMRGARVVRALGPLTPADGMALYFEHFPRVNPLVALKIAQAMHQYDAGAWLEDVDVPALIVVGGRDRFTPPAIGRELAARLPDAELLELPDGTHGAVLEFPDEILAATVRLVDERARRRG